MIVYYLKLSFDKYKSIFICIAEFFVDVDKLLSLFFSSICECQKPKITRQEHFVWM